MNEFPAMADTSHTEPAVGEAAGTATRIAYLLSRYPAISHTFFLQEVQGLRQRGLHIETASINSPDRPHQDLPPTEQAESASTFYLKRMGKRTALVGLAKIALRWPGALLRGLRAVAGMGQLTLRRRALWMAYLAEALLLGAWMKRRGLPHLHVHFGGPVASVALLTSVAWKIPYSITIHGPEELLDHGAFHLREKLAGAAFIVCISDFCRSQVMLRLPPEQWKKLHVVRLGVAPEFLRLPPRIDRPTGTVKVLCVGRLVPEKGQHLLLTSAAILCGQGLDLHVTLVGDGPERAALEQHATDLGMMDYVTFAGALSHPQTREILQTADLFVLPSFAEGIPVALMEAMAFRIPCISTYVAGIPELIRSGVNGMLVPPSNVEALTAAMELLVRDPHLREQYGAQARLQIDTDFSLENNLSTLALLFSRSVIPAKAATA